MNNKPKIMIVEDSTTTQLYLAELLHGTYELLICSTGEEGLELVDRFGPELVLLDIVLPGISGYEVCKQLRSRINSFKMKIIFLSSQKTALERLTGYHSGAEDYITKPFNADELLAKIQVYLRLLSAEEMARTMENAYKQTLASLARAMEAKDEYTQGHSDRVSDYAERLGVYLKLDPATIKWLQWAGRVHDIGKIGIPDAILLKREKLTEEEFRQIKSHPVMSYQVLEPIDAMEHILLAVKYHHEHYDGSGYPDGLKGEEIPLLSRIIQIADVWDALTTRRPYREAMGNHAARQIMIKEAGTTMDPTFVSQFLDMLKRDAEESMKVKANEAGELI